MERRRPTEAREEKGAQNEANRELAVLIDEAVFPFTKLHHWWQKPDSIFASPASITTWPHATACVYHLVCRKVESRVTRWVYGRNKRNRRIEIGEFTASRAPGTGSPQDVEQGLIAPAANLTAPIHSCEAR